MATKIRIIQVRHLPIGKSFYAISLCGWVFCRGLISSKEQTHELIHYLQQREMLYIPFFLWYIFEFLLRSLHHRSFTEGYRHISFEQEAYHFEQHSSYPIHRRHYTWRRFIQQEKTYR